jgi:hypothetical protein
MNRLIKSLIAVIIAAPVGFGPMSSQAETASPATEWNFDDEQPGTIPAKFSIGTMFDGRPAGNWQVIATDRAKSPPHVFAQASHVKQSEG